MWIEHMTLRSSVWCSPNWAIEAVYKSICKNCKILLLPTCLIFLHCKISDFWTYFTIISWFFRSKVPNNTPFIPKIVHRLLSCVFYSNCAICFRPNTLSLHQTIENKFAFLVSVHDFFGWKKWEFLLMLCQLFLVFDNRFCVSADNVFVQKFLPCVALRSNVESTCLNFWKGLEVYPKSSIIWSNKRSSVYHEIVSPVLMNSIFSTII